MKNMITLIVPVSTAEDFIRQMSVNGYDVATRTDGEDDHSTDYEFFLNGRISDKYAANIDYLNDQALIYVRPE